MIGSVSVKELCQAKDTPTEDPTCVRPPISFASPSAFFRSVYARFLSLWTPSFIRSILYGQVLSLTLTVVSVLTTELVHRNWVLPSTQVIFPWVSMVSILQPLMCLNSYVLLCITYTPYTIYRCKMTSPSLFSVLNMNELQTGSKAGVD